MKLDPHISLGFNGQCEAAFRLYERCLDGTIAFMVKWGNSPAAAEAPPGWEAKIYHATLRVGDIALAGGDLPRSEEHTSELQSRFDLVCRLLLEKKNKKRIK